MKLKNVFDRIPRPVRACACAVCVMLLAIVYYIALGCPTLFLRQEFRRAERAHLVGPSEIVDTLDKEQYYEFDKLLVGETEYGVTFFGRYYNQRPNNNPFAEKQYFFAYVEKTGAVTMCAAPNVFGIHWTLSYQESLPVYLFTENSKAVKAKVQINVCGEEPVFLNGESGTRKFNETFYAEANRTDASFFRFWIEGSGEEAMSALFHLSSITGAPWMFGQNSPALITAIVWLYDANENLILEEELVLHSPTE